LPSHAPIGQLGRSHLRAGELQFPGIRILDPSTFASERWLALLDKAQGKGS